MIHTLIASLAARTFVGRVLSVNTFLFYSVTFTGIITNDYVFDYNKSNLIVVNDATNTTLLATSPEELQHQVNELHQISLLFGLEINSAKTCMMVVDPADTGTQSVLIDGKEIERVNKFKYLGSLVTVDSNCTTDIKAKLTIARHATCTPQLTGTWRGEDVGIDLKQLVRSLI